MRIVIIGAGATGRNLAARLCDMHHDVIVIDPNGDRLSMTEEQLDILAIEGSGSSPDVLETAQIGKADLLVAVSNFDEVNILACQYARAVGVQNTVARVANQALLRSPKFDLSKVGVSLAISHKEEAAREVIDILRHPGALEVVDLLDGRLRVCGVRLTEGCPLLTGTVGELSGVPVLSKCRIIAIFRDEALVIPRGDTACTVNDEIYVAVRPDDLPEFLDWAVPGRKPFSKVVVAGGGDLGLELAHRLEEEGMAGVMIECCAQRAGECSDKLKKLLVLRGDASDQETLANAGLGEGTAYLAITGDEELNIISCILAKKMGASFTLAQVAKAEYVPIVKSLSLLDRVVSPYMSLVNAILHFLRGRHVRAAALLHKLPGELLHVAIAERHKWVGRPVGELKIPAGCVIVGVLRSDAVSIPTGRLVIAAGDELVLFVLPELVGRIQGLFKA